MPKSNKELERELKELKNVVAVQNMVIGGFKGGKNGTGKAKARTSAKARAAVNARWNRFRERKNGRTEERNCDMMEWQPIETAPKQ